MPAGLGFMVQAILGITYNGTPDFTALNQFPLCDICGQTIQLPYPVSSPLTLYAIITSKFSLCDLHSPFNRRIFCPFSGQ